VQSHCERIVAAAEAFRADVYPRGCSASRHLTKLGKV
jgi:hypothetical protein